MLPEEFDIWLRVLGFYLLYQMYKYVWMFSEFTKHLDGIILFEALNGGANCHYRASRGLFTFPSRRYENC